MNDNLEPGVSVEILHLMKFAGVRDDIAIARFHELVDRHGCRHVRRALFAVAPGEVSNVPLA